MKTLALSILSNLIQLGGFGALTWWMKTKIVRFIDNFDTEGWRPTLAYFGFIVEDDEDE
ncbi:MAG: hypothetical protein RLZZ40_280 [Actinomycetota bacterium]|jgi:hypothetical protein